MKQLLILLLPALPLAAQPSGYSRPMKPPVEVRYRDAPYQKLPEVKPVQSDTTATPKKDTLPPLSLKQYQCIIKTKIMKDKTMLEIQQALAEAEAQKMEPYLRLAKVVRLMRDAQKAYFAAVKSGNPGRSQALENSKRLERTVDVMLDGLNAPTNQPSLFDT
jgi:hypothetical protein